MLKPQLAILPTSSEARLLSSSWPDSLATLHVVVGEDAVAVEAGVADHEVAADSEAEEATPLSAVKARELTVPDKANTAHGESREPESFPSPGRSWLQLQVKLSLPRSSS